MSTLSEDNRSFTFPREDSDRTPPSIQGSPLPLQQQVDHRRTCVEQLDLVLTGWIVLCLGASLAVVLLLLRRGLDLTDEGYYLLGYRHPQDVFLTLAHFQPLVAFLTGNRPWPVAFYRVLGLLLTLGASLFFAIQALRSWERYRPIAGAARRVSYVAFTVAGGLLYYAYGPRSMSYNSLNNFCVLVEAGLFLKLTREGDSLHLPPRVAGWSMLLGFLAGSHFIIKARSAVLVLGWMLAASALLHRIRP